MGLHRIVLIVVVAFVIWRVLLAVGRRAGRVAAGADDFSRFSAKRRDHRQRMKQRGAEVQEELVEFHRSQDALATMTAVQPPGRFGAFTMAQDQDRIQSFHEKPDGDGAWVNGGYFVLEPSVIDYIEDDRTVWEREPLEGLARDGMLAAYRHDGFWQPMDTLRDKNLLEELWTSGQAPWKVW